MNCSRDLIFQPVADNENCTKELTNKKSWLDAYQGQVIWSHRINYKIAFMNKTMVVYV